MRQWNEESRHFVTDYDQTIVNCRCTKTAPIRGPLRGGFLIWAYHGDWVGATEQPLARLESVTPAGDAPHPSDTQSPDQRHQPPPLTTSWGAREEGKPSYSQQMFSDVHQC